VDPVPPAPGGAIALTTGDWLEEAADDLIAPDALPPAYQALAILVAEEELTQ
jgi:hypothetical protein